MRSNKLLIALTLCLSLSFFVSAHPGKTDSNGGHLNHSTGEYHYHHSYSAHQHSDMDGDGDLDCPYSFDDKTESSGNKTESSKDDTEPVTKDKLKKGKDYTWVLAIIFYIAIFGLPILVSLIRDRLKQ